jgi:UDP-N-acetylglucosamine:LPS N-acetylglucosamine transferase
VHSFVSDLYRQSGAADVVIARGGATNLAEFALQGQVCLIVPSKQLGWNVQNAAILAREGAIVSLSEDQAEQPERLGRTIGELLTDVAQRQQLASRLATYARPRAARDLAVLIMELGGGEARAPRA